MGVEGTLDKSNLQEKKRHTSAGKRALKVSCSYVLE